MKFMRVWVCSKGDHDKLYIESSERRPQCPICGEEMSKAKSEGMPVLCMTKTIVEVPVDENGERVETPYDDLDEIDELLKEDGQEPFEVEPPKLFPIVEKREPEPLPTLTPRPALVPKKTWSRKKGAKSNEERL